MFFFGFFYSFERYDSRNYYNIIRFVSRGGLEPPSLSALPPQGSEFANFSIWTLIHAVYDIFYFFST